MRLRGKRLTNFLYPALIVVAFIVLGRGLFNSPKSGWKTDFSNSAIDLDEVISGGVPRDGIPPIDNPTFVSVEQVNDLSPQSPVISIDLGGIARAYPLEVLTNHEIVNDVIEGVPVAVTFCPLCNSAIVFDRRVDGQVLRFGVSGKLRNSDLIMWDDLSESWWQQLTGEAIVGHYRGYQLQMVTSQLVSFDVFRERYPGGEVLRGPRGGYGNNPYVRYDSSAEPFLYRGTVDKRLFATERVLAAEVNGQAVAYSFGALRRHNAVNDRVKGIDIVVFWQAGAASALDASDIDSSRDVGMALMFDRQLPTGETLTFRYESGVFIDEQTNSRWNIWGEAKAGPLTGTKLEQMHAYSHFWFAWAAFYPQTTLFQA